MKRKKSLSIVPSRSKSSKSSYNKDQKIANDQEIAKLENSNCKEDKPFTIADITEAERYNTQSYSYYRQKLCEKAKDLLLQSIKLNPAEGKYYTNLSQLYLDLKQYTKAFDAIEKTIELGCHEASYSLLLADQIIKDFNSNNIQDKQLLAQAMKSYTNAGDEGYNRILEFYYRYIIISDANAHYPFLKSNNYDDVSVQESILMEAALPALEFFAYHYFAKGDYIKALEAFDELIAHKTQNLDIYVTAKETINFIGALPFDQMNNIIADVKKTSLVQKVGLGSNQIGNLICFLKYKTSQYQILEAFYLGFYNKELLESVQAFGNIRGIADIILLFLAHTDSQSPPTGHSTISAFLNQTTAEECNAQEPELAGLS